jgi:hypothetical protein
VFTLLGTRQRADWEREFASTTSYLKFGAPAPISTSAPSIPLPPRSFSADLRVMLVRYVRTVVGDRKRLVVLLVQAPVLGLLLSFVLFQGAFSPQVSTDRRQYLLATILVMVLLGGFNSVREIVQDREVFRREVAVGVSAYGFVLSRWLVLGVTAVMQAVVLHLTASLRQLDSPGSGALLASGSLELMLALAGIGVVSVGIGLLISATVSDTAKALTALPLVILATLLLSGLVVPTSGRVGIQEVTYLNPVQWGSSAAAVSVDLRASTGCPPSLAGVDVPDELPGGEACTNDRWERSASTQAINFAGLVGWSLLLLFLAGFASRWTMGRPLRRS